MKSALLLVLAAALVFAGCETAPTAPATAPLPGGPSLTGTGTCAPKGPQIFSPWFADWIANGVPTSGDCWNLWSASFVSGTTDCGYTANAIEFGYSGSMHQEVTIPSNLTQSNWELAYTLDFIDPNNDGAWNRFTITVSDQTAGGVLAYDQYFGNTNGGADLYCDRRKKFWTANLAGHTLSVRVTGSKGYTNTHIRIREISLFQD